jgi:hypothetical protein
MRHAIYYHQMRLWKHRMYGLRPINRTCGWFRGDLVAPLRTDEKYRWGK